MSVKCGSLGDAQKVFDEMGERDLCSWNTMISGYAKMGKLEEARKLFDEMPERDNFSWTAMISGYVHHAQPREALELYRMMLRHENSKSNKFTVTSALAASAAIPNLRVGKEIHGNIMRIGLDSDEVVWSVLSDIYFEDGRREEGFDLFSELTRSGIRPNDFTFAGVLNACADHAAENLGKQVHGYLTRIGFDPFSFAASALVHMYSKCGNVENSKRVFNGKTRPDLVSWTSLIVGYAQNGQPNEALKLFELLLKSGTQPDHITFVGVLSACTHAGLVDKGLEYFHSIKEKHGLRHTADHYACIIDLLARAGRFGEAENIINKMPMKPDKFLWASLLGGCRIHGNLELAKRAAEALFEIEPENPATYVTLANIYATAGMWGEVAKVRKAMDDKRVVKKPGLSWIEIKREVHVFLVGDKSHPKSHEIHNFLGELSKRMKEEGYIPDTNFVLHDVEEEQKEQNLSYHSEKLAVAFGIISTPPRNDNQGFQEFKNLCRLSHCY
uniref:DYW domain-containing protein n=1 Tax=Fagus sylvatica TaxID=28930 RepID=A0A2N9FL06_FAGSY